MSANETWSHVYFGFVVVAVVVSGIETRIASANGKNSCVSAFANSPFAG